MRTMLRETTTDTRSKYVAHSYRIMLPQPEYLADTGYCGGCLSELPQAQGNPEAHTCGYGGPPDGLHVSVRLKTGNRVTDGLDLEDLPL